LTLLLFAAAIAVAAPATPAADYQFTYRYPPEAARIAGLRRWLEADRARLKARTAKDANKGRQEAAKGDFPYRTYETSRVWQRVTRTPRFLSLSREDYVFTGGAHGSPSSGGLLWDKRAQQVRTPKSLFTSEAALGAAVRTAYCNGLTVERKKKGMGADPVPDVFAQCPAMKELTLLLGSTDGRAFDRIGLIADPYVAGSYAEGAYEVTLPLTHAMIAAVKPAYRTAFAVSRPAPRNR
jgi:hypothetical protein